LEPIQEECELIAVYLKYIHLVQRSFCQNFSWVLGCLKRFDGKFQGEIWQFERRNLANLSPKFAVKLGRIFKLLIFNTLQDQSQNGLFCQIFLPVFTYTAIRTFR
jgi:hypothetical protein